MTEQEKRAWTRTYILNARINAYKSLPELRFNPYHDDKGRFTTKEGNCLANKTDNKNKNSDISDRKAYSENNAKNGLTSINSGSIMNMMTPNALSESGNALENLITSNGIKIKGSSKHYKERLKGRNVSEEDVKKALVSPLHIDKIKENSNGKSQRFIGETATVNVNPETGNIITTWKTGKSTVRKYKKGAL